jgi:DNA-binding MarR family transcriptional regulator
MFSNNSSNKGNPYLRFLQLAKAIQNLPDAPLLDANENALLEAIALRWFEQKPMTVREAIGLSNLGSPATLHKRITRLRNRDLVQTFSQTDDKRAKFLVPTEKSLAMFNDYGKKMNTALTAAD